jgi:hypothetical protein
LIGLFPDPYPDELLFSVCARYKDRMCYPNRASVVQEFFGNSGATISVDFPSRLDYLITQLPTGHTYTSDQLINQHTLAPLYIPFLPTTRADKLREEMRQTSRISHTHERVGAALSIKNPKYLRFCSQCAKDELKNFGESYWHRAHQVPGVDVCSVHQAFLGVSGVPWFTRSVNSRVVSANSAIHVQPHRPLDLQDRYHSLLLKLARDMVWLLDWCGQPPGMMFLYERYYNLLLKRGLAFYNGRIRTVELSKQLIDFYSIDFLRSLQCNIERCDSGWVYSLVHTNTDQRVQHPLRHLLLMTFLGLSAQEFFTSFEAYTPFGQGPWPCFNKASNHFMESRITDCRITDSRVKGKSSRPMGTFHCECGFTYTRMGPDSETSDRLRVDSVQDYGWVWENRLRELWSDSTVTQYQMADTLGTAQNTVVRRGIHLGLQYPRNNLTRSSSGQTIHKRYKIIRRSILNDLKERRERLLLIVKSHPNAGRLELQRISPYLFDWLRRHDRDWLNNKLPPPRRSRSKDARVDWQSRDRTLVTAVKKVVKCIRSNSGRPIRVSLAEIIRSVGHRVDLEQRLHKLPQTAKTLSIHLETLEAFAIRTVKWAESCFLKEGTCPTRRQLIVRAGVRNKTGTTQPVQSAIDIAMERLRERYGR